MTRKESQGTRSLILRLTLLEPPAGVPWAVQLGRTDLLPPVSLTRDQVVFEIPLELVISPTAVPRLRGAAVQGPSNGRFLYVNSGTRAGEPRSGWDRRAKVPLASIPLKELHATASNVPMQLHAEIAGTAKDGGPACASVPLLRGGWSFEHR